MKKTNPNYNRHKQDNRPRKESQIVMKTKFTISRKTFYLMLNVSSLGMGIAFVYYAFIIESYYHFKEEIDVLFYFSLSVFLFSGLLKLFKN